MCIRDRSTCVASRSSNPEQWPLRRSTKQAHVDATALIVSGDGGFLLEAREGRTLGGLWGLPYAEGEAASSTLLKNREAEKIGHVRHDFTHKRLNITVYISEAKDSDELRHPDSVPMATLDRKVLNFLRGYLGEQS